MRQAEALIPGWPPARLLAAIAAHLGCTPGAASLTRYISTVERLISNPAPNRPLIAMRVRAWQGLLLGQLL